MATRSFLLWGISLSFISTSFSPFKRPFYMYHDIPFPMPHYTVQPTQYLLNVSLKVRFKIRPASFIIRCLPSSSQLAQSSFRPREFPSKSTLRPIKRPSQSRPTSNTSLAWASGQSFAEVRKPRKVLQSRDIRIRAPTRHVTHMLMAHSRDGVQARTINQTIQIFISRNRCPFVDANSTVAGW